MGTRSGHPGVEIRLLGPLEVAVDGRPVHVGSKQQRAVLALLALHAGQPVAAETLCDLVWEDQPPADPAATLQSLISRLRAALSEPAGDAGSGRGVLRTQEPGWVLDVEPASVDALHFRELASRGRARAERGEPGEAANDLAAALALWRGAPLADLAEVSRLTPQATTLDEARLDAVEDLAEAELSLGRPADALARLERHVASSPLRERGWAQLMTALYRLGRQAAALRAYQQVRSLLRDELGLEPSALLVETEQRILRQDPGLSGPATVAPVASEAEEFADYSVLVVEDHDFQRRTVVQLLSRMGVGAVDEAADGAEALDLLATRPGPDIVICDIDMPGMDGVEFVGHVAERGLADAVVIASGLEANVVRAVKAIGESHGLDVLAALEKPLTARTLGDALRRYARLADRRERRNGDHEPEDVQAALARGEIRARFRPRIDLSTGEVSSVEAESTWLRPDGSVVPAAASARREVAIELASHLVAEACWLVHASDGGGVARPIRVAAHLMSPSLGDASLADRMSTLAGSRRMDPRRLVWEVEEVALARAPSAALEVLTRLRVKGFGLSMRHTGLATSWPSLLARAPLSELKLGRSLVTDASTDSKRWALLESAVAAAREAGLPVVAEGCDSQADFDALVAVGCTEAQGRVIADPMSGAELVSWAATHPPSGPRA